MDQVANAPEAVSAAVTVLPSFEHEPSPPPARAPKVSLLRRRSAPHEASPELEAVAVPPQLEVAGADASPAAVPSLAPPSLSLVPEPAPATAPSTPAPAAVSPTVEPTVAQLQVALREAVQRAESAEGANAVLRRRLALLDDELAAFRPRAIVPFEDNTD